MARRRRGEKRRKSQETSQVEMLGEAGEGRPVDEADGARAPADEAQAADDTDLPAADGEGVPGEAAPAVGDAGSPADGARPVAGHPPDAQGTEGLPPLSPAPSERWARVLGRRGPAHASDGAGLPDGAELLRAASESTLRETDRDHAHARVRPAGEPLARAKDLVQQGRVEEAIDLYLGILTVNPSNLKARNNLGVLLDQLRQYDGALEHLAAAERLAPENVEVLTNYAATLTSVARYDQADAVLRRALRLDAESPDVRLAIGILYFRRGLYAQAESELRWVCARDRGNGQAFYYRGEALNRVGRFDEARQAMERAKILLPNDPRPFYTLGHLYDRQHQPEEAAEMYRQARRLQDR